MLYMSDIWSTWIIMMIMIISKTTRWTVLSFWAHPRSQGSFRPLGHPHQPEHLSGIFQLVEKRKKWSKNHCIHRKKCWNCHALVFYFYKSRSTFFFLLQEFPLNIHCDPAIEVPESSDSADDICWHLIKEEKYIFNLQKRHFLRGFLSSPH